MADNYLLISDLQAPFHAKGALSFLKNVQRDFKISHSNIICVGDEIDYYHMSKYPKNPDMEFSAKTERESAIYFIRKLSEAFPTMRICTSNHGVRPLKKLLEAGIPSSYMKEYRELIEAPLSWEWKRYFKINTKHPFVVEHGSKYSGKDGHRNAAIHNGISTAIGHIHSFASIDYIETEVGGLMWAFNTGCLIDKKAIAFEYDKENKFQPILGCGVVLDSGKRPIFIPYET